MVVRLAIAAVIGGGALAAFGWKQERLAVGVRDQPQQLSVSQLEASGYGENRNVVVTDFYALPAFAVQEEQVGSNWESIWVPIIPLESDLALWIDESYERGTAEQDALERNAQFKIIAQVDVKNTAQLDAWAMADTFRGIFIDGIHDLDAETKEILRDSYPYADIARAYVVHVDREVPSADGAVGIMFAGTALVIGGLGVGGYRLYYQTRHGA